MNVVKTKNAKSMPKRYLCFSTRMETNWRSHFVCNSVAAKGIMSLRISLTKESEDSNNGKHKTLQKITWQRKRKEKKEIAHLMFTMKTSKQLTSSNILSTWTQPFWPWF